MYLYCFSLLRLMMRCLLTGHPSVFIGISRYLHCELLTNSHTRYRRHIGLAAPLNRDEDIEPSRQDKAKRNENHDQMHDSECEDVKWVVAYGMERWICEREDDG